MRAALLALACGGCFAPRYPEGLACATGSEPCPPGQTCGSDGACHSSQFVADAQPTDGAPLADGMPVQWLNESTGTSDLLGVWGEPGIGVFAVGTMSGTQGVILQRGSPSWSVTMIAAPLRAIGGSGTTVWAVGTGGRAEQFAGSAWSARTLGGVDLAGVAFETGVGVVVGKSTTLLTNASGTFQPVDVSAIGTVNLAAVTVEASGLSFAAGEQTVIKYDGSASALPPQVLAPEHYLSVWAAGPELYAGTNTNLWRYNGTVWMPVLEGTGCSGLDGDSRGAVWCATDRGVFRGSSATAFVLDATSPQVPFSAIHVVGNDVYAVGAGGAIWHRTSLD